MVSPQPYQIHVTDALGEGRISVSVSASAGYRTEVQVTLLRMGDTITMNGCIRVPTGAPLTAVRCRRTEAWKRVPTRSTWGKATRGRRSPADPERDRPRGHPCDGHRTDGGAGR